MRRRPLSRHASRPDLRGFSLVEVMVAVVLLGIGTTLLSTALARAMTSVAGSRMDLVAATVQRSRIEQLRALPADRCAATLRGATEPVPGLTERWEARPAGTEFEIVDSIVRSGGNGPPLRTLMIRIPCQ